MADVELNPNTPLNSSKNESRKIIETTDSGSFENLKSVFEGPNSRNSKETRIRNSRIASSRKFKKSSENSLSNSVEPPLVVAPRPDIPSEKINFNNTTTEKSPTTTAFSNESDQNVLAEYRSQDILKDSDSNFKDFDPSIETDISRIKSISISQNSSETLQAIYESSESNQLHSTTQTEDNIPKMPLEEENTNINPSFVDTKIQPTTKNISNPSINPDADLNINTYQNNSINNTPKINSPQSSYSSPLENSESFSGSDLSYTHNSSSKNRSSLLNDSRENLPIKLSSFDISRTNKIPIKKINSLDPSSPQNRKNKHRSVIIGNISTKFPTIKSTERISLTDNHPTPIKLMSPSESNQSSYRNSIADFYSSNKISPVFNEARSSQPPMSSYIASKIPLSSPQHHSNIQNNPAKADSAVILENANINHNDSHDTSSQNNTFFTSVSSLFTRKSGISTAAPPHISQTEHNTSNNSSFLSQGMFSSIGEWMGKSSNNRISSSSINHPTNSSEYDDESSNPSVAFILSQIKEKNNDLLNDPKATLFEKEELGRQLLKSKNSMKKNGRADEIDWEFWGNLISNFEQVAKNNSDKLSKQIHRGVPQEIRGTVWQLLSSSSRDPISLSKYRELISSPSPHDKQIVRDLVRTFPDHSFFKKDGSGQSSLFNILHSYSIYDPGLGYCQGLAFIAGPLLLNMPEEEAFCVFKSLMNFYKLRGLYIPNMELLQLRLYQLDRLIEEHLPALSKHFIKEGVRSSMYSSQWFMTLFAYCLPMNLVFSVFDIVFAEGVDSLLQISLAVLKRSQTKMITMPFEQLIKFLTNGELFEYYTSRSAEAFMHDIEAITVVTPKRLARLTRDHEILLQKTKLEEDAKDVLKSTNKRLELENKHLLDKLQSLSFEHSDLMSQFVSTKLDLSHSQEIISKQNEKIRELEARLSIERMKAEESLRDEMEKLANKNLDLAIKHQLLEDKTDELENALVRVNTLYADSENDRITLLNKWNDLRKAMN
ncbi:GTPase-activating protein GYP5 [Smittium culicis]|uniref:GTPase-activating protein GYP5 n=3 Tax=Smittium culicis TaxID=133412 RepID=A0A1R1WXG4_9FUNG|nr:GTPase-activating protein GYP5 [Smittium culicis]